MVSHIAPWVLLVEGLSWAAFLLLRPVARTWPDHGFGASKTAGVLMLALGTWVVTWYGAASPSAELAWAVTGALGLAAGLRLRRRHCAAESPEPAELAVGEGLWLLTLGAFLLLRAANPALAGGEKFMDSALFAASIRATAMPPVDPWLAGSGVNYYFFGYWLWAQPARMLGTPPELAYNLAMATIPAQVAAGAYSAGRLLARRLPALVSSIGLVWSGTWAGAAAISTFGPSYDYWTPTRVIPGTINEFPFFSFFWGDLHPHVMAMPNFLLCVGLCLTWLAGGTARASGLAVATGASLGMAVATSVWDAAPLGLLVAAALASAARTQRRADGPPTSLPARHAGPDPVQVDPDELRRRAGEGRLLADRTRVCDAVAWAGLALVVAVTAVVVVLPAAVSMETGPVAMGLASTHSPGRAWLLVQGGWLLPIAAAAGVAAARRRCVPARVSLLLAVAAVLLALAELVFVDDVYGRSFERMNVVFKLHLHAMLLFGVAWAWALDEIGRPGDVPARAANAARAALMTGRLATVASMLAGAVYPAGALTARWSAAARPLSLDGTAYLALTHPDDRALILFAARAIAGQPVIAEATGNQYGYAGRVSALTGLPAVLGWAGHERLWRRTAAAAEDIDERARMVQRLYEGRADEARRAIARYRIRYIVLGDAERQAYAALQVATLDQVGHVIFASGAARLYEVDWR